jgi:hypothetical protein
MKIYCMTQVFILGSKRKWRWCDTAMAAGESVEIRIPGEVPYMQTLYTCPDCGHTQTVNDFGRLDGIGSNRRLKAPKKAKIAKPKVAKYRLRYCFENLVAIEEGFTSSRAAFERAGELERNPLVIKDSICRM